MVWFSNEEIAQWINEDAPLVDLTSHLLGIEAQYCELTVTTRHSTCLTLTEEATRLFEQLGADTVLCEPSGRQVDAGTEILKVTGRGDALHRGWKVAMNLLETGCGVATATADMVAAVQQVSDIPLLVTRKHAPGMKKQLIKAILSGGAYPHRLGLSETVLIFENHLNVIGGREALPKAIQKMKAAACEKKIMVECDDLEQAVQAAEAGADAIQFDKVPVDDLVLWCQSLKTAFPALKVLMAGGIRRDNVEAYAASGVDGIVLSSLYHAKPADLGVRIQRRD
ncbi:ModD protein [Thiomicrospira sp. S5]|uniref:ModD protein n=1 Tax=Thiomicrospira sp. S5 TaxID=1803865 RepID=UPI000F8DFDE1|nr:ModD protein [Thiomicrospira sp. S5]